MGNDQTKEPASLWCIRFLSMEANGCWGKQSPILGIME